MYNRGLFADWVPKPMMLLLIIVFLFPILGVSGVFTNNLTDISGAMAAFNEHVQMANNAVTIGMSLSLPILMRVKMRFRSKEIIVTSTLVIALMVLVCAHTDNVMVYIAGNFIIGFFKMFPMLEVIIPVMFMLSPKGDKGRFYSIFYPIAIGSSSIMSYYLTSYAFDYGITNSYYIYVISMLVIAALSVIFQHNKRFGFKLPLYQIDWISLVCLGISMMSLNYALTFLKQQNWFNEPTLKWSLLLSILLFIYVIFRQSYQKRKIFDFSAFLKYPSVQHSIIILLFQALYLSSSSVFMQWTMGILGYNALISAKLNLWMLPGLIIGGIIGFYSFKKNWNIKYYILMGFGAFFLHTLLIYLFIQPSMNIEMLYFPTVLKGIGMVILFIGVWFYATKDLPTNTSLGVIGLMMSFRTFVTLGITGGILGYFSIQLQAQSLHDLSNYWDSNLMGSGALQAYGLMQMNTMLAAGKTLLGYCLWLVLPVAAIVLMHDYGKPNNRRRILVKKRIKGESVKGYRYKSNEL